MLKPFNPTHLYERHRVVLTGLTPKQLSVQCTPCFRKKTFTHIIGYKLRNSCLILIIFDIKVPHIIWHRKTA